MGDLCFVDHMSPGEQVVVAVLLCVHKGINQCGRIGGFPFKLLYDPVQSAAADMVVGPKDVIVPEMQMVILLVEDV